MDITCGRLDIEDIIACSLSLKKSDYKIFEILLKSKENITIQGLSEKLKLDRTTIQKILKILSKKGLIIRYQKNLVHGGYVYSYAIKDKHAVKSHIKTLLSKWYDKAINQVDDY